MQFYELYQRWLKYSIDWSITLAWRYLYATT